MALIDFGGVKEEVVTREEFPLSRAQKVLENEVVGILGYGPQGYGQSLNLRDNGIRVIVGQRKGGKGWNDAVRDGWVEGKTLFEEIAEVVRRSTVVQYLLSDAGQKEQWPAVKRNLRIGQALYFSHGFSIVFKDQTGVVPPPGVDVILVAPKGAGRTVRSNYLAGSGINASFAIYQDATGSKGAHDCTRHRGGIGLSLPHDIREGSLQRSDRRAWRSDGRDRGRHESAVRDAARDGAFAERSV